MTTRQPLTQQAFSAFGKASEVFENNFLNNTLVRTILDDYAGTLSNDEIPVSYSDEDADCHKSLGCFFDGATNQLSKFLKAAASESIGFRAEESFSLYALLVSMLLERILDVSAVVSLNDGTRPSRESPLDRIDNEGFFKKINAQYMRETYEPMYQMGRWANFFKHPKELGWLLHQPQCMFAESAELANILTKETRFRVRIIDDDFIRKHYETEYRDTPTRESLMFENKPTVIALPNIVTVTEKICECLCDFVEITATTFYYSMLNNARKKAPVPE